MVQDAKFEDGVEQDLRLKAESEEDLNVIAALAQDSVFPATEIRWAASQMQFSILLNRFRWEDKSRAEQQNRDYERVQSVLMVNSVLKVQSNGIDPKDADTILSLIAIGFVPTEDGAGTIELILAGDGAIRLTVECIDVTLQDVTRPYVAPSKSVPSHELD